VRILNADGEPDTYSIHTDIKEIFLILPYHSIRAVLEVVKQKRNETAPASEFQLIVDPSCL
jgi:hypothetical protein